MAWNYPKVGGARTIDPGELAESAERNNAQTDFIGRANSISCPVGIYPGSAWFVVPRTVIDGDAALDRNTRLDITWKWTLTDNYDDSAATITTFKGYVIHNATCQSLDGDSKGAYLLEMRDVRQLLFASTSNKLYNVSHNVAGAKQYFDSTSYAPGTPWTWQQILSDLWNDLPTVAGTVPTLPFEPAFTPDTIRVVGTSTWEAIGQILDFCQAVVTYDPLADAISLQRLGDTQTGLAAVVTALEPRLILDYKPKSDCKIGNVPEKLSFVFPRRTAGEPKQIDGGFVVDISTGIAGAQAGTKLPIPMPLIAEYALLTDTTPTNAAACSAAATEMSAEMIDRMTRLLIKREQQYSSIVTSILPGCDVHLESWEALGDENSLRTIVSSNDDLLLPDGMIIDPYRKFSGSGSGSVIAILCSDLNDATEGIAIIPGSAYDTSTGESIDLGDTEIRNRWHKAGSHGDEIELLYDARGDYWWIEEVQMQRIRPATSIVVKRTQIDGEDDLSQNECLLVTGPLISAYLSYPDRPRIYCKILEIGDCPDTSSSPPAAGECNLTAQPTDIDVCGCETLASSYDCSSSDASSSGG